MFGERQRRIRNALKNAFVYEFYAPDAAGGYRYDEVPFDIAWPLPSQ